MTLKVESKSEVKMRLRVRKEYAWLAGAFTQTNEVRYVYDPYGNILSMSGPMAVVNPYRFSSKEYMGNSGLYAYGYRFYEPSLQRWLNRDPEQERGGVNLYSFVHNMPINAHDPYGLSACTAACGKQNLIDVAVCWVVPITISAGGCYLFPPACAAIARAAAQTAIACTLAAEARYAVCMAGCVTT